MASKVIDNRVNFGSVKNPMPFPDFLDVQLKSFKDFLQLDTPPELSPIHVTISFSSSWITISTRPVTLSMSAWSVA